MSEFHKRYLSFLTYALEVVDDNIKSVKNVGWVEEPTSWGETTLSPEVTVIVDYFGARNCLTNLVNIDSYRDKVVSHINKLNISYFPNKKIYVTKRNVRVIVK
jgi:hypothetical protein